MCKSLVLSVLDTAATSCNFGLFWVSGEEPADPECNEARLETRLKLRLGCSASHGPSLHLLPRSKAVTVCAMCLYA